MRGRRGLVFLLMAILAGCAEPRQHAVFIVIDTLRADALAQTETPHLDALAERGDQVDVAWSSATWTVPSVISMFTGQHVREHGWDVRRARMKDELPPLPENATLAEVLAGTGFDTSALCANVILSRALKRA